MASNMDMSMGMGMDVDSIVKRAIEEARLDLEEHIDEKAIDKSDGEIEKSENFIEDRLMKLDKQTKKAIVELIRRRILSPNVNLQ
jgi:hypothetical protein